ncbi:MAG: flagellar biosynthesis anti-sigma factor FlgM [Planctomycetia bacterium]|nr:flagellar biosynthesis anti-sigma factor FlgM [Planctomycetia bacterium]
MDIYGSHLVQGTPNVSSVQSTERFSNSTEVEAKANTPVKDEVEISSTAREISETRGVAPSLDNSEIRLDLVNQARAKIAAGVYDAPEYLEAALEKMLARW